MLEGANEVIVCLCQTLPRGKEKKTLLAVCSESMAEDSKMVHPNFTFVGELSGGQLLVIIIAQLLSTCYEPGTSLSALWSFPCVIVTL